jgi:hypothetical protein
MSSGFSPYFTVYVALSLIPFFFPQRGHISQQFEAITFYSVHVKLKNSLYLLQTAIFVP